MPASAKTGLCEFGFRAHEWRFWPLPENVTSEGGIIEAVVWRVPVPVAPSSHGFKYRAVYSLYGVRVAGFDNERGKGDHCHVAGKERPYVFTSVDQLIEDFIAAVEAARSRR